MIFEEETLYLLKSKIKVKQSETKEIENLHDLW